MYPAPSFVCPGSADHKMLVLNLPRVKVKDYGNDFWIAVIRWSTRQFANMLDLGNGIPPRCPANPESWLLPVFNVHFVDIHCLSAQIKVTGKEPSVAISPTTPFCRVVPGSERRNVIGFPVAGFTFPFGITEQVLVPRVLPHVRL
jgi:hypothetical protein